MTTNDSDRKQQQARSPKALRGAMYGSKFIEQPRIKAEAMELLDHLSAKSKTLLEIGFDHGRRLHSMALCNPDWQFVGLEIRKNRVQQANERKARDGLSNLLVWRMDARTVFANVLNPGTIDVIDIFFPTPWTQSPYHDERLLLTVPFLQDVSTVLKPSGLLRVKTDVAAYSDTIENNARIAMLETVPDTSKGWIGPTCNQRSRREWRCDQDSIPVFKYLFRPRSRQLQKP